ncbi:unnamed protein product, partial [marine sediment metagenome]
HYKLLPNSAAHAKHAATHGHQTITYTYAGCWASNFPTGSWNDTPTRALPPES